MKFEQIVAPTIKELFIEKIQGMVLSGELKPGDKLPSERELSEQMKISKSIVHLGLETLERMGFVEIFSRSGTFVADFAENGNLETLNAIIKYNGGKLDKHMIISIIELRSAIEGGALVKLGNSHSEEDMSSLRLILEDIKRLGEENATVSAQAQALSDFHYNICKCSQNKLFPLIMNAFRHVGFVLWESSVRFWGAKALYAQGQKTLDLVEAGRGKEASEYLDSLFLEYIEKL